jgi:hypothetical protein
MTRLFADPQPIEVTVDPAGVPLAFRFGDGWRQVTHVANRWRVTSSWWNREAAAAREYVKLVTADGLLCAIYRDMTMADCYLERIYD